jgi:5-carboxymethyl-2-hydroxymuconate isomerase
LEALKQKSILPLAGIETRLLRFPAHRLADELNNLNRFKVMEERKKEKKRKKGKKKIKQCETKREK